jgi:hypothetical protein
MSPLIPFPVMSQYW